MEDPKRMRTKLRLDLKDVRRQIEDLDELLKKDKSPENVEAHRKLVEYEKKLKEQYEKMTGLSVDQAEGLQRRDVKVGQRQHKKSPFSGFLALLGGLLIGWGFYNTVLHSIPGYGPQDILNYFTGQTQAVPYRTFILGMGYEGSVYFIMAPIAAGAVIVLLSGLFDGTRRKLFGLLDGLGLVGASGIFAYVLFTGLGDYTATGNLLTDYFLYFAAAVAAAGFFIFIGSFGQPSILRKLLILLAGLAVLASGAQYLLVALQSSDVQSDMASQWPLMTVPLIIGTYIYTFVGFLRIIK